MELLRYRDELIITKVTTKVNNFKRTVNGTESDGLDWTLDILPIIPQRNSPYKGDEPKQYFGEYYKTPLENSCSFIDVDNPKNHEKTPRKEEIDCTTDMLPATFCETTVSKVDVRPDVNTSSLLDNCDSQTPLKSKKKKFCCSDCPYSTDVSSHFRAHIRRHTGERPFACPLCPYRAAESCTLNRHRLTHSGSKKHCCPLCPYKAFLPGDVAKHMRCHTGEKPYSCPLCPYRASRQSSVKEHLAIHSLSKEFSCDLCGHMCATRVQLRRHMKNKHLGSFVNHP